MFWMADTLGRVEMGKIVKKIRNISPYKLGVFESWLSDMAAQGLHLKKMNFLTCSFEKSDQSLMEYRVVICNRPITKEQIKNYQDSGWSYVCSYREAHIFCALASESLVEMQTNPVEQSKTLIPVTRKMRFSGITLFVLILLMLVFNIFLLKIGNTPYLNLINHGWQISINTGFLVIVTTLTLKEMYDLINIKKQLAAGRPLNYHVNWRKGLWVYHTLNWFSLLLIIFSLIEMSYQVDYLIGYFSGSSSYNLTMDSQIPIVRLSDIEECKGAVLKEDVLPDGYNGANRVNKKNDLITNNYDVTETYYVENETWEDSDDVYTPSLHTEYYEINIPLLIDGVMEDLVYQAEQYYFDGYKKYEKKYKGLDRVYFIENKPDRCIIVARKNNKLIKIHYLGKQDYSKVLRAIADYF